ncbi:MAG TPA: hypothetical protein PLG50_13695 [bacterium]|nr:hypothetical protein [bacterium]HQG46707.1 hypothetical protein [bacterium]HQI48396.1 hypothetical protein [bacterium]HQJ64484.1 hypothetical protein [bacterium]
MRNTLLLLLAIALLTAPAQAQLRKREVNSNQRADGRQGQLKDNFITSPQLIDLPTANVLLGGDFSGGILLFEEGGMVARLSAGISRRMMFGISYGGDHLIGNQVIKWNDGPSVHLALRMIDESPKFPKLTIGIDTQGYGKYWRDSDYPGIDPKTIDPTKSPYKRFTYKSRGFYAVTSKNYQAFWTVGLHVGVNYSLETSDKDKTPDLFCGMNWQLGRDVSIVGEYDFAWNNDRIDSLNGGRGFLNCSLRWAFQPNIYIELAAKNLLAGSRGDRDYLRCLKIVYFTRTVPPPQRRTFLQKFKDLFSSRNPEEPR